MTVIVTVPELVDRALAAYARLAALAETIEDEAQYLSDLTTVWTARLRAVAREQADTAVDPAAIAALETLETTVTRIEDPHRAFDWLSTFPQVLLLALHESP